MNIIFILLVGLSPSKIEDAIERGLTFAYVENYEEARRSFHDAIVTDPKNPAGYFFTAALLQFYMADFCTDTLENQYYQFISKTKMLSKKAIENDDVSWGWFYLGAAHLYNAIYEGWHKRYMKAFVEGIEAPAFFSRALEKDSTLFDSYLGLGVIEYFKSQANEYILGLELFGNREKAIADIQKAVKNGHYLKLTAKSALSWIFIEENKPDEALKIIEELHRSYPNTRSFKWLLCDALKEKGEWLTLKGVAEDLFSQVKKEQPENYANHAQAKLYLAYAFFGHSQYGHCLKSCMEIKELEHHENQSLGLNEHVAEAEQLKNKARAYLR